jgi:uncharacterized YccA/Bax inhibitor family protein
MLVLLLAGAAFTWSQFDGSPSRRRRSCPGWRSAPSAAIVALITVFKKTWSPVTAPIYAVLEGLFLGAISAMFELRFPGIVMQAVGLTFGTLFALLAAYRSGLIRPPRTSSSAWWPPPARSAWCTSPTSSTGMFRPFFGFMPTDSWLAIGFSGFVVVIAALNLVLDFDFIEKGVEHGAPKYMEWYAAFGLMVTLVWLYLEILRLLSKLQSRN